MRRALRKQIEAIRKPGLERERIKEEGRKPKKFVTVEEHYASMDRYKKLAKVSLAGAILSGAAIAFSFIPKWYVSNHPPKPSAEYAKKLETLTKIEKIYSEGATELEGMIKNARKELSEMDDGSKSPEYENKLRKADDLRVKGVSYGGLGVVISTFAYAYFASKHK